MESDHRLQKHFKFQQRLQSIAQNNYSSEEIHNVRTVARELYALLDNEEPFRSVLKQLLKHTNKIRDIDVFWGVTLPKLPYDYRQKLDIQNIYKKIEKERQINIETLKVFMFSLSLPESIRFATMSEFKDTFVLHRFEYIDKKPLHSYRLHIKHLLYREKNSPNQDIIVIKRLSRIKDILGHINDNLNALRQFKALGISKHLLKEIKTFIYGENEKLFREFQIQNAKLL